MPDFVCTPEDALPPLRTGWGWDWGGRIGRRGQRGNCVWYINKKIKNMEKIIVLAGFIST